MKGIGGEVDALPAARGALGDAMTVASLQPLTGDRAYQPYLQLA